MDLKLLNMKHKMASLLQLLLCLIHHKQDGVENKSDSTEKSQNRFQNDGILFLAHKIGNYVLSQCFLSNRKTDIKSIQEMKVQNGKHYFENTKSKLTKIAREKEFANTTDFILNSYLIRKQAIYRFHIKTKRNQTPPSAYERVIITLIIVSNNCKFS
ncbi:hypothetical protein T06_4078 [Trichinella sp. T6]|nr:hypothetical protein T06_4078 [Trichinella sp. T6]